MEHRTLGRSGVSVSVLGLGVAAFGDQWGPTWTTTLADARRLLHEAVDAGITHLDTSSVYNRGRSEEWLGALLDRGGLRERVMVSTKFGYRTAADVPEAGGSGAAAMRHSVLRSLRRLRVDRLDLLYLHLWDGTTPPEETLDAADALVAEGLVGHFALSNVPGWYAGLMHGRAAARGTPGPVCLQLQHNLLVRRWEQEVVDLLEQARIGLVCWGPLANGLLAGRYDISDDTRSIDGDGRVTQGSFTTGSVDPFDATVGRVRAELSAMSRDLGVEPAQVAIAWLLARSYVSSVMIGVSSLEQLRVNVAAADLVLDDEVVARLDAASAVPVDYPHTFLEDDVLRMVHGPRLPERRQGRGGGRALRP